MVSQLSRFIVCLSKALKVQEHSWVWVFPSLFHFLKERHEDVEQNKASSLNLSQLFVILISGRFFFSHSVFFFLGHLLPEAPDYCYTISMIYSHIHPNILSKGEIVRPFIASPLSVSTPSFIPQARHRLSAAHLRYPPASVDFILPKLQLQYQPTWCPIMKPVPVPPCCQACTELHIWIPRKWWLTPES